MRAGIFRNSLKHTNFINLLLQNLIQKIDMEVSSPPLMPASMKAIVVDISFTVGGGDRDEPIIRTKSSLLIYHDLDLN